MKTKKEINRRIYEIFEKSDENSIALTNIESARVQELQWVLGIKL